MERPGIRAAAGTWRALWGPVAALFVLTGGCRNVVSGDPFDPDLVLRYGVELDETDWDVLRYEGRSLGILAGQCNLFEAYTPFRGVLDAAGVRFANTEIRKKGTLGSLSSVRPSLKLDVGQDREDRGRRFRGQRRITLNNNHQDPSNVRQCLALGVFAAAGLPAPQCNLAEVSIQGAPKGIYTHVEAVRGDFLTRVFGDDTGNLYEGDNGDFSITMRDSFELKTNELDEDRSDLDGVIAALAAPPDQLWDQLDAVVDMDEFLTFAAVEALVGHVDGYASAQNNVFIYADPADGRFRFIPWGPDQTFRSDLPNDGKEYPVSVYLENELFDALWPDAAFRQRYDDRMRELLDTVWDEAWLQSEALRWRDVAGEGDAYVDDVLRFVADRRAAIEAELGTDRGWPNPPRRTLPTSEGPDCRVLDDFSATFVGTAAGVGEFDFDGTFEVDFRYRGADRHIEAAPGTFDSAIEAGIDTTHAEQPRDVAFLRLWRNADGDGTWMTFILPPEVWHDGTHPLHGFEAFGVFGTNALGFQGFIGDGFVELTRAPTATDPRIRGRIEGKVIP